jgi:hypothetical protein
MSSQSDPSVRLTPEQEVRALLQISGLSPDEDEIKQFELLYPGLRSAADSLYPPSCIETGSSSLGKTTEEHGDESWWG